MDVTRFRGSPSGDIVPISGSDPRLGETYEHWAFVPHPRPVLNVATTATRYDVSFVAANKAVAKLVDRGLLAEITGRGHDRVFRCDRVLQILER